MTDLEHETATWNMGHAREAWVALAISPLPLAERLLSAHTPLSKIKVEALPAKQAERFVALMMAFGRHDREARRAALAVMAPEDLQDLARRVVDLAIGLMNAWEYRGETDTWDAEIVLKGCGDGNGGSFLTVETLRGPHLPVLGAGFVGFRLHNRKAEGHEVDRFMNDFERFVSGMFYTGPTRPGWPAGHGEKARARKAAETAERPVFGMAVGEA